MKLSSSDRRFLEPTTVRYEVKKKFNTTNNQLCLDNTLKLTKQLWTILRSSWAGAPSPQISFPRMPGRLCYADVLFYLVGSYKLLAAGFLGSMAAMWFPFFGGHPFPLMSSPSSCTVLIERHQRPFYQHCLKWSPTTKPFTAQPSPPCLQQSHHA